MIHIFKHSDGTYDRATVRKGRFIHGSNQRYSKKSAVIRTILQDLGEVVIEFGDISEKVILFQDDTGDNPVLMVASYAENKVTRFSTQPKRMKKYIPNNNKSKK